MKSIEDLSSRLEEIGGRNFMCRPHKRKHDDDGDDHSKLSSSSSSRRYNIQLDTSLIRKHLSFKVDDDDDRFVAARKHHHRRLNSVVVAQPPPQTSSCDFLGSYGKGRVPVESCTVKQSVFTLHLSDKYVPSEIIQFYNSLKQAARHDSFEMIFVVISPHPGRNVTIHPDFNESYYSSVISHVPCPIVPIVDATWRSHLFCLYRGGCISYMHDVTFIDTKDNAVKVLMTNALPFIHMYGPNFYPFTKDRMQQLEAQHLQLAKKTSILDILGSKSRDFLIDRHFNKVPISRLQNKDVLLLCFLGGGELAFIKQLGEIYNHFWDQSFEIVSINLDYNCGSKDEKAFNDTLAETSWLSLPFGDDKIWNLRNMMTHHHCIGTCHDFPILFIKPKGESLLDPYGFHVLQKFGIPAYPFSRQAAARSELIRLKGLSFKSFVDKARHPGLNFDTLIRNKSDGGTEPVSLSTIMEKRATKGILLYLASLETCSEGRLNTLITAYLNQKKSSSSFEVIFLSFDKDMQSFGKHFSAMPWFAFPKPLNIEEYYHLAERTAGIGFLHYSHFLAFGPDGLLQVGLFANSFEKCEFPFINDAESTDHLAYCISGRYGWWKEADDTFSHTDDRWYKDIERKHEYHSQEAIKKAMVKHDDVELDER